MTLLRILAFFAVAIVATMLSLRLLGTRRGWGRAVLSGTLGWTLAAVIALDLSDWHWGERGVFVVTVAIGVPATMAVAVVLDLLARPGSLAIGDRAGFVVAPRPLRALRRRVQVLRRYRELILLARREGFGTLRARGVLRNADGDVGVRLRRVLEGAGGVYIKLGQIAATRVDVVPPDVARELARLQNRVPAVPADAMKPVLEAELGGAVDTVFSDFDWEPLAAGSIGQTYTGRLRTGEAVVVKVQRPGIKDDMERDLAALALVAEVAQRRTAIGQGMRTSDVLEQFAASLREELDFMQEADAMVEMASRLGPGANVRIPKVCHAYCTRRLLVQERFDGWTVADLDTIEVAGFDREALGVQLLRSTMQQVLGVGYFHADPHPGNIFVFRDGMLGLIDFGAVGRLDPIQQAAVVDILAALVRRDISLLRDGIERVADLTESVSPDRLERALARLVALHVRPNGTVDANVLPDLVALLTTFGVHLPGEIVVLSRALVTLDGTLRVLAPGLSLVAATTDIAMSGDAPVALAPDKLLHDEIIAALPQLRRLPDRIDRILTLTGRGDLRIRHVMDEDGRRTVRTLANRALLSLVGAAFLLAATMLLVARDAGPAIATHTGLFEVFGYGGLLIGTVLVLRVVAAVTRDGTT